MKNINIPGEILSSAVELRHTLHKSAELSGREERTKRIIMEYLSDRTSLELHDMGAWFYAAYRSKEGKKRIAFRADMDALPIDEGISLPYCSENRGVSHKCGHDGHSASLAAFAEFIDKNGCENDIFFLFQHAEENGDGAEECDKLIALERIDEIYGYHNMPGFPLGSVSVHTGCAACASTGMTVMLRGKNSHASQPENGRNPAFALAELILAMPELVKEAAGDLELESPNPMMAFGARGMVMCTVIGAGISSREDCEKAGSFGTSAGFAHLALTIRAEDEKSIETLEKSIIDIAEIVCERHGLTCSVSYSDTFPETRNDGECAEKVREAATALELPIAEWNEPFRSSEDFGYYTKKTKGALFYIGSGVLHAPLHTVDYDFADELIGVSARLYASVALCGE
ncbi:MAG: M20/M25/M40 family metallo-hydrolase [Clostridia bacterium]|nr:M20/M25/M40 family metallo-hydrolase [Clostridia bacterium]